jgi:hypothetical protein
MVLMRDLRRVRTRRRLDIAREIRFFGGSQVSLGTLSIHFLLEKRKKSIKFNIEKVKFGRFSTRIRWMKKSNAKKNTLIQHRNHSQQKKTRTMHVKSAFFFFYFFFFFHKKKKKIRASHNLRENPSVPRTFFARPAPFPNRVRRPSRAPPLRPHRGWPPHQTRSPAPCRVRSVLRATPSRCFFS